MHIHQITISDDPFIQKDNHWPEYEEANSGFEQYENGQMDSLAGQMSEVRVMIVACFSLLTYIISSAQVITTTAATMATTTPSTTRQLLILRLLLHRCSCINRYAPRSPSPIRRLTSSQLNYHLYTPTSYPDFVPSTVNTHFVPPSAELRQMMQERSEVIRGIAPPGLCYHSSLIASCLRLPRPQSSRGTTRLSYARTA